MKTRKMELLNEVRDAEKTTQYRTMAQKMKELVKLDNNLNSEERKMLKVAYTEWTNDLREKELYDACKEISLTLLLNNLFARTMYQINDAYQLRVCNVDKKKDFPSDDFDRLMEVKVFYLEMMIDFFTKAVNAAENVTYTMINKEKEIYNSYITWFTDALNDARIAPCILKELKRSVSFPVPEDLKAILQNIRKSLTYTVEEFHHSPGSNYYTPFSHDGIETIVEDCNKQL